MLAAEFPDAYNRAAPNERTPTMIAEAYREVFNKRYQPVQDAGAAIVGLLPEIRALFPESVATAAEAFLEEPWRLRWGMQEFVDMERRGTLDGYNEELRKQLEEQGRVAQDIVFAPHREKQWITSSRRNSSRSMKPWRRPCGGTLN